MSRLYFIGTQAGASYETLEKVQKEAIERHHEYCGDYSKITYITQSGTWEYMVNDDLGISSSLEQIA